MMSQKILILFTTYISSLLGIDLKWLHSNNLNITTECSDSLVSCITFENILFVYQNITTNFEIVLKIHLYKFSMLSKDVTVKKYLTDL